jgi:hypothetical protein
MLNKDCKNFSWNPDLKYAGTDKCRYCEYLRIIKGEPCCTYVLQKEANND